MAITKTIGGDRVGSGRKMHAHLHNYYRSTHNLSEKWASSMASGILYPCFCKLAMRGDSFDISVTGDIRSIPTRKALFGSYKMQIDFYQCPVRLYQALLHNNPQALGLNMKDVKFPIMTLRASVKDGNDREGGKINDTALLKYLGLSGIGMAPKTQLSATAINRKINAIPALAYYDIFKTYYANKQEEKAYVITPSDIEKENALYRVSATQGEREMYDYMPYNGQIIDLSVTNVVDLFIETDTPQDPNLMSLISIISGIDEDNSMTMSEAMYASTYAQLLAMNQIPNTNKWQYTIGFNEQNISTLWNTHGIKIKSEIFTDRYTSKIALTQFDLTNIDDMRYDILSSHTLGTAFEMVDANHHYLPYTALTSSDSGEGGSGKMYNSFPLNGLVIKTYQNDIFNNWLNTDWIEGENGINEMSKVSVVDGKFSMDALNFAQKLYNMLNRIAIAGATYEDWQDVVYEEVKRRQIESPIFIGGMSQEVMFDEVIQTTPTEESALGTIGCRGRNVTQTQKGGKFHVKCDEASFIIGIISLTPRQFYTQGNEFYLTDVLSMDDIHKPPMDGIGFQDLIGERMAWWDTKITAASAQVAHRSKIGKLPAWIEYMTSVDKAYGDMAGEYGTGFMVLNRNYEYDEETGGIKDATTYIDPSKYNYAFAYTALDAQNFWCELGISVKARRLMSARLIPNV